MPEETNTAAYQCHLCCAVTTISSVWRLASILAELSPKLCLDSFPACKEAYKSDDNTDMAKKAFTLAIHCLGTKAVTALLSLQPQDLVSEKLPFILAFLQH